MKVDVRYFASLREALGDGESVDAEDGSDVAALRAALASRDERHAAALGTSRLVRAARNRVLCADGERLRAGDEIAFFPPVTGG